VTIDFLLHDIQCRTQNDNWEGWAHIHIFVFCFINLFWNQLFLWYVNTNIWICAPPPIIVLAIRHWRYLWFYAPTKDKNTTVRFSENNVLTDVKCIN
jgi:hypothetical protein